MRLLASWPEWWPFVVAPTALFAFASLVGSILRDMGERYDPPQRTVPEPWRVRFVPFVPYDQDAEA